MNHRLKIFLVLFFALTMVAGLAPGLQLITPRMAGISFLSITETIAAFPGSVLEAQIPPGDKLVLGGSYILEENEYPQWKFDSLRWNRRTFRKLYGIR